MRKALTKRVLDIVPGDIIIDGVRRLTVKENVRGFETTRILECTENGVASWLHEDSQKTVKVEKRA